MDTEKSLAILEYTQKLMSLDILGLYEESVYAIWLCAHSVNPGDTYQSDVCYLECLRRDIPGLYTRAYETYRQDILGEG